jgi:ABC-type multidrug transport system ATPase subunit
MISIEHVSKTFGAVRALHDVSLFIQPGERVGLVGSNGSGKTTLLRALLGLLRVTGRVRIDGHDVARAPELALAHVAYVPQIAPPLEAPVHEVVRAYAALRGITQERVLQFSARMGLALAPLANTRFRDLSGGMKQKLLAALALATHAEVLVRAGWGAAHHAPTPGGIVVLCSHRQEEVQTWVDRVVTLYDGELSRDQRSALAPRPRLQVVQ